VAIFTYGFPLAGENFKEKDVKLVCLSNYESLIDEALRLDYIGKDQLQTLEKWREEPENWGKE